MDISPEACFVIATAVSTGCDRQMEEASRTRRDATLLFVCASALLNWALQLQLHCKFEYGILQGKSLEVQFQDTDEASISIDIISHIGYCQQKINIIFK